MPLDRILPCSLWTLALLAGCSGGASGGGAAAPAIAPPASAPSATPPPAAGPVRPVAQSDLEIAELAYTDTARVPAGFRVEPARYTTGYVTLAHVRSTDLDTAAPRPYELCTDDFGTALAWSERVARSRPEYGDLVENNVTPLYHEFVRRLRTAPARDRVDRIYRCAYLDRGAVDLRATDGDAGRLNAPDWSTADLQQLGEYLWSFTPDNNAGRVVLASGAHADPDTATHSLHLARLTRAAAAEACDRIDVVRVDLTADRASGAMMRRETRLWSFGARRAAGTTMPCPG